MTGVRVEAPARLHLGMFDVSGSLGRHFGGLGVALTRPAVVIEARRAAELTVEGPDAARALEWAGRYLHASGISSGAHLRIEQAIPAHVGLGSGTKLALAVARALATLYDRPDDAYTLARTVGRGVRSAIGLWTFERGGLVVEGGRRPGADTPAPLLLHRALPPAWRCVLVVPHAPEGLSGAEEVAAFEQLARTEAEGQRGKGAEGQSGPEDEIPTPHPQQLAAQIAHVVLMALLPALVEGELAEFGAALTRLQQLVGDCFGPVQGGQFGNARSRQMVEALLRWGAAGAGQSSWGPAVYGLVADEQQGRQLAARAEQLLDGQGRVELVAFNNQGARLQYL